MYFRGLLLSNYDLRSSQTLMLKFEVCDRYVKTQGYVSVWHPHTQGLRILRETFLVKKMVWCHKRGLRM